MCSLDGGARLARVCTGGLHMPTYRMYRIDAAGHIPEPSKTIECDDEDHAVEQARQYVDGLAVELWEGARLIRRFESNDRNGLPA
jgi:hypothetical protein